MPISYSFSAFFRPVLGGTAALLLGLAAGCTYSHGDPAPTCDAATQTITYRAVVSPIFDAHCRECHGSTVYATRGAGYDFGDYQGIKNYSSSRIMGCIKHEAGYPAMPQNGDKLSDCDIERLQRWIDAGQPNN